jgi:hypothetical protein
MYPTGTKYDHPSILMEDKHDVQLLSFHPNLDPYRACGVMGLSLYLDIVLQCWYSSMHLLLGFLSSVMLFHKCVDVHAPSLMIVSYLYGVDGDIQQL